MVGLDDGANADAAAAAARICAMFGAAPAGESPASENSVGLSCAAAMSTPAP